MREVTNRCDGCDKPLDDPKVGLSDNCAERAWDRWFDRHDDIGSDE
jgi:hypothetical protein